MIKTKLPLIVTLVSLFAAGLYFVLIHEGDNPENLSRTAKQIDKAQDVQLSIQLDAQKESALANKKENSHVTVATKDSTVEEETISQTNAAHTNIEKDAADAQYGIEQELADKESLLQFSNDLGIKHNSQTSHATDPSFEAEAVDPNWAYKQENNIHALIQADQSFGFNIQNLSCKTTRCELELMASPDNSMYLGAVFSDAVAKQPWHGENASINFDPTVINGTIKVRIGRNEGSLAP